MVWIEGLVVSVTEESQQRRLLLHSIVALCFLFPIHSTGLNRSR